MDVQILIDAIVRQTTVLIAQLATSGGLRAPLAHVANQVFVDLSRELESQGVSRKVSADMFGMALRGYVRKLQRLRESSTDRGRSLWEAVYGYLRAERSVTRKQVLQRFDKDDEALVRGVLRDLTDSGLIFATGTGARSVYRIASEEELRQTQQDEDADELVWVLIYREGPLDVSAIERRISLKPGSLEPSLERLIVRGDITRQGNDDGSIRYSAKTILVPLEASTGWEASIFDHYHALVQTICRKLNQEPRASAGDAIGGSTYTFDVWPGHPYEERALSILRRFREEQSELRKLVQQHNDEHESSVTRRRIVVYAGQYVSDEEVS